MLSQLFQPSDQRPDYIKCCSIQAYYKDFTAHSLITSSTISFNFSRLFSTGNIFLFFPLLLSLYQSSTFQYDDTSNIFSCYGFISRNPPHDKFVEAYVREDTEHACESESERILPTMSPKSQTSVFFATLLTVLILPHTFLLRI